MRIRQHSGLFVLQNPVGATVTVQAPLGTSNIKWVESGIRGFSDTPFFVIVIVIGLLVFQLLINLH